MCCGVVVNRQENAATLKLDGTTPGVLCVHLGGKKWAQIYIPDFQPTSIQRRALSS
jgi:hypothetical protein